MKGKAGKASWTAILERYEKHDGSIRSFCKHSICKAPLSARTNLPNLFLLQSSQGAEQRAQSEMGELGQSVKLANR